MLEVGKMAPAFTLENQDGDKVALKSFRGEKNVVLYFYPKAMTPGCTTQACGLRDFKKELAKLDAVAIGMSPDAVGKLKRFEDKYDLNFDLLADLEHKIADKYEVWGLKKFMGREYMGINRRTFIIGKDGKLKNIMMKFKTTTHHEDVIEILKTL
ncbi:MAG: peroxiredoxin Q/BCP [Enterobacterales bacterium]|jgi:peroxiredoxin Q/BCP